jgi:hypothetical protein
VSGREKLSTPSSLFPSESEIARLILGANAARWPELAKVEERCGLPRIDPLYGGRYWPAVKAYLDNKHGVRGQSPASVTDGGENWNDHRHAQRKRA